jgi:hypothetical protein
MWTMARLETRLLLRGRGIWIAALILALLGGWMASMIREQPEGTWSTLTYTALLSTLVLTLSTGAAVQRDADRRTDGMLLSTPVPTWAYVLGKYVVAVVVLVGLSLVEVAAGVLADHFDDWRDPPVILGHSHYPPLGPFPFVAAWAWLMLTPVIFGAALMLAGITLARGQRVLAYALALAFWLIPMLLSYGGWPLLLDLTGVRLSYELPLNGSLAAFWLSASANTPAARERIMDLVRSDLPPRMPAEFIASRALFLGLALLLVLAATSMVARRRRGEAWPGWSPAGGAAALTTGGTDGRARH